MIRFAKVVGFRPHDKAELLEENDLRSKRNKRDVMTRTENKSTLLLVLIGVGPLIRVEIEICVGKATSLSTQKHASALVSFFCNSDTIFRKVNKDMFGEKVHAGTRKIVDCDRKLLSERENFDGEFFKSFLI